MTNYTQELVTKIRALISEFEQIDDKITWNGGYSLYYDYREIANYQLLRILNALTIAESDAYREAFVVLRVAFENYLYYLLITRGKRYFNLFSKQKGKSTKKSIEDYNQQIANYKAAGDQFILKAVQAKGSDLIEVHYEGRYVDGKKSKGNLYPIYLDIFKQFDPNQAHLSPTGYFEHGPPSRKYKNLTIKNSKGAKNTYRHYLTMDAILYCLRLNNLSSEEKGRRIKAHYNFLSQFVHPNYKNISAVKVANRVHSSNTNLQSLNEHSDNVQLLANLYAAFITCGVVETYIRALKASPKKFIKSFDSSALQTIIDDIYSEYSYFWFIYNGPSDCDKFWAAISRPTSVTAAYATYQEIPDVKVKFNPDILKRLADLQGGWSNHRWGRYQAPFRNV